MQTLSVVLPLLLLAAAGYVSPTSAKTISIPWGVKPSVVYAIRVTTPTPTPHKTPTKPHKPPTKPPTKAPTKPATVPTKPTAPKKPPPPTVSSVSPPPPAKSPPPPAPISPPPAPMLVGGRRSLLAEKLTHPYRYLVEFSKSHKTYVFKPLTVPRGTKLKFKVGSYGSKGHHGLARTSTKYRCGHALKTYLKPTAKVTSSTVSLPHKGTFHFFDPTLTPVEVFSKKGKFLGKAKELVNCSKEFISLTVIVS